MADAKTGPHLSSSASPRVSPCENRWLDGRRRCTLRGGLGGNRPRFRKGSKISDGAWGSAGVPADRSRSEAEHPIRHQQALEKHRRRVRLGCRDLGARGLLAWKDGGWRCRAPGRGRREGGLVVRPHPHAARWEATTLSHSIEYNMVISLPRTVRLCWGTSDRSRRPAARRYPESCGR
jgi:hypothetical protein